MMIYMNAMMLCESTTTTIASMTFDFVLPFLFNEVYEVERKEMGGSSMLNNDDATMYMMI